MSRTALILVCVTLLAVVITAIDTAFFRNHFWARLLANIGIVLVFAAFSLRFLK